MTDDPFDDLRNPDGTRKQEYPTDIEIRMHKGGTTNWSQPIPQERYRVDRTKYRRGGFHVKNGKKV